MSFKEHLFGKGRKEPAHPTTTLAVRQVTSREVDLDPGRKAGNPFIAAFVDEFMAELDNLERMDNTERGRLTERGGVIEEYSFYFSGLVQAHQGNPGLRVVGAMQYGEKSDFSVLESERRMAMYHRTASSEPILRLSFFTRGDFETASKQIRSESSFVNAGFLRRKEFLPAISERPALATTVIEVDAKPSGLVVSSYASERRHPSSILIEDVVEAVKTRLEEKIDPQAYKAAHEKAETEYKKQMIDERARIRQLAREAQRKELEGPKPGSSTTMLVA